MSQHNIKQVILYRRDLKMRKGKIAAQCAHASMKVFFDRAFQTKSAITIRPYNMYDKVDWITEHGQSGMIIPLTPEMATWVYDGFKKVVLSVETEEDLLKALELAQAADIPCSLITDNGATEFKAKCKKCHGRGTWEWLTGCPDCGCDPIDWDRHEQICEGPAVCQNCNGTGKTGVPTNTCVAIGPADSSLIDPITGPEGLIKTKLA